MLQDLGALPSAANWPNAGSCTNQVVTALTNGSTPTCTSLTSAYLPTALPNNITTNTQTAGDDSTKAATTAYVNTIYNLVQTSGSPYTLLGLTGTYWNNTASAYTFQLDAPVSGKQYCFGNYQARSGVITIKSTTSVTIYFKGVAGTTGTGGSLVSGGAAGDFICLEGTDSTTYIAVGSGVGTWTNN